jgi:hypothetical protein
MRPFRSANPSAVSVRECRREHALAVRADHQRDPAWRPWQQHGILDLPEPSVEGHAVSVEQPPDDLERLLEAGDAMVVRQSERAVLGLVPAGAETKHEATAAHLGDGGRHPGEQPRRMEPRAGDERAEPDAPGHGGEGCEQ